MNTLVSILCSPNRVKDTIAIARGVFRVSESIVFKNPTHNIRTSSWMEYDTQPEQKSDAKT